MTDHEQPAAGVAQTKASEVMDLLRSRTDPMAKALNRAQMDDACRIELAYAVIADRKDRAPNEVGEASLTDAVAALSTDPQTGKVHSEILTADEGGCVTKRFVIFTTPGMSAEKKGGWLKDEHLIDFLREVALHDGWKPGFEVTVLELTWNNDLWASNGISYLRNHDDAIGPRRARKAWKEARAKHERIYKSAPSSKLGTEIAAFLSITRPTPLPAAAIGGRAHG